MLKELSQGDLIRKTMVSAVEKGGQIEVVDRSIWVTASAETPDRDEDIIFQGKNGKGKGWDFGQYDPNPVIMSMHDYRQPPIGENTDRKIVKGARAKNPAGAPELWMRPKFADNQLGDFFLEQYVSGNMKAWSVGFMPTKWDYRYEENKDNTDSDTQDSWPIGYYFYEQALWELSGVPIPSNPDALTHMRSAFKSRFGVGLETLPVYDGLIKAGALMLRGGTIALKGNESPDAPEPAGTTQTVLNNTKSVFNIVVPTLKGWTFKATEEEVEVMSDEEIADKAEELAEKIEEESVKVVESEAQLNKGPEDEEESEESAEESTDNGGSSDDAEGDESIASDDDNDDESDSDDDFTDDELDEITEALQPVVEDLIEVVASAQN